MTKKQDRLYWREWAAVLRACPDRRGSADEWRHELHAKALGAQKSHKLFTNADFDQVLAEFRAWSQPANLKGQVRQIQQPRARALRKVAELVACLELYHPNAEGFVNEIVRDKFVHGSVQTLPTVADLSHEPRVVTDRAGKLQERPSQLQQLIMTLGRAVNGKNGYRARAGDSVHDMLLKAGLKCGCKQCFTAAALAGVRLEEAV